MARTALTLEETNHLRAVYLSYRLAPKAVRTYFDNIHPPSDLVRHLAADKHNLQKIRGNILRPYQWTQLYPNAGVPQPVSTHFDVTLLICLLRNMTPVEPAPPFGFDMLPDKAHTSGGAHLARIKFYRNILAHSTDGKMTNSDFSTFCLDLEMAIMGLGGPNFKQEINDAKTIPLDKSLVDLLQNMTTLAKQYIDLSNAVDNNTDRLEHFTKEVNGLKKQLENITDNQQLLEVKGKIQQLETAIKEKSDISSNQEKKLEQLSEKFAKELRVHGENSEQLERRIGAIERKQDYISDSHRLKIEEWETEDELFFKTKVIDDILESLKHCHCVTVTGSPGIGKSASIHHVALILRNTRDFDIFPCKNPSQIEKFYQKGKRQLYVFDDVCGKYSATQSYVDKWKRHMEDIDKIISLGGVKIICSCRIQVFMELQFQTLKLLTKNSYNLNSDEYLLDNESKLAIAKKYLSEENVDCIKDNISRYEFLPLMFSLFRLLNKINKDVKAKDFFDNPFEMYTKELDKLQEEKDKSKFCALFLLVVHNGSIYRNVLTGEESKETRQIRKAILKNAASSVTLLDNIF